MLVTTEEKTFQAEHNDGKCLLPARCCGQRKMKPLVPPSVGKSTYSPHQAVKTTAGGKCFLPACFLSPKDSNSSIVQKSLLNVINLKEKTVKEVENC